MPPRFTFNYSERLHLQKDFKRVFKTGRKMVHPAVFVYICPSDNASGVRRMGLVTSRKIGTAVERNRVKRRLREIFRLNKHSLTPSTDIIFVLKPGVCKLNYEALKDAVLGMFKKAGVLSSGAD